MTTLSLAAIALLLLLTRHGSAYPHPPSNANVQSKTGISNVHLHLRSKPPTSPPLTHFNSTALPQGFQIACSTTGNHKITVDSCRPTLNHFRVFPDYRRIQSFLEGKYPKKEPPPLILHHKNANCGVKIASLYPLVEDRFSWEQIRATATDIVADCEDKGGWGGWSPVGTGLGFYVRVLGFVEPGSESDTSTVREGVGWGGLREGMYEVGDRTSLRA
ncbi:hypothetical protein N7G274_004510 [Stereocaulon virgatum]|uniref:Uncharacterized protein n=1 Tax=Stereocaulon virgatum TaxID=373712 RepID=A0ABR4AD05_9LECA